MHPLSSQLSFYRYLINTADDIQTEALTRRRSKARQNYKTNFCYEISSSLNLPAQRLSLWLNANAEDHDIVIVPMHFSHTLCNLLKQNLRQVILIDTFTAFKEWQSSLTKNNELKKNELLVTPKTTDDLKKIVEILREQPNERLYWRFEPYNQNHYRGIAAYDIYQQQFDFKTLPQLEIHNPNIPEHYELQPEAASYDIKWETRAANNMDRFTPAVSVIIPSYNSGHFMPNVLRHLIEQSLPKQDYEVIIVDDGSQDDTWKIIKELFDRSSFKINLKYIYWTKNNLKRGPQYFFRSGLARNLGVHHSKGDHLLFLDSDMLVPPHFLETALKELKSHDIIQFQRYHIKQDLSFKNPSYEDVKIENDTYIEERHYWSQLFYCRNWMELPQYWKYTCTYALALKKKSFIEIGGFKKYYVSYGFEDTDLGYEAHKKGYKFNLVKLPLLHLTSYDQQQYQNSFRKRVKLLRVTAELFYLQHLEPELVRLLGDYFKFQKNIKTFLRDLF